VSEQATQLIGKIMRAWNAPDRDGILDTYAEDAVIEMPGAVRVEGKAAIAPWLDGRMAELGEFRTSKVLRACEGDYVCVEYDTYFRPEGGEEVHVRGAEVYRMDGEGRIREQRQYNFVVPAGTTVPDLDEVG
jgi:nuclear transport factor 2 (NTF2) superfamily protein